MADAMMQQVSKVVAITSSLCVCTYNTGWAVVRVRTFCVLWSVLSHGFSIVSVPYMQHFTLCVLRGYFPAEVYGRCVKGVCVLQCN